MDVPISTQLTAGDVARELGIEIAAVLDLVYQGALEGRPDPQTGRILVTPEALERYRRQPQRR